MSDVAVNTVLVSSILEETPEGLYHMERIRRDYDAMLAEMSPQARAILEDLNRELDLRILGP